MLGLLAAFQEFWWENTSEEECPLEPAERAALPPIVYVARAAADG